MKREIVGYRVACNHCEFFVEIMNKGARYDLGSRRQDHEERHEHVVVMYEGVLDAKHEVDWRPSQFSETPDNEWLAERVFGDPSMWRELYR